MFASVIENYMLHHDILNSYELVVYSYVLRPPVHYLHFSQNSTLWSPCIWQQPQVIDKDTEEKVYAQNESLEHQ